MTDVQDSTLLSTANAHSVRLRSQDQVANSPALSQLKVDPSSDSERGVLIKSQSFPQQSAPQKKGKENGIATGTSF